MSDRILQNYEGGRIPIHLKTIDEVELLELLGVGGFGMVWKVRETRRGNVYVLKIIQGIKPGSVLVERVRLEAEVAIPSPHVVTVIGLREWDPSTFLILFEYFPARTLDKLLHDRDFTPKRKRHIFSQILRGVADAHSCNIIHRDLKPANILVDNKDEVKLIDFGLSKFKGKGLTMTGDVMGTPPYMSPELLIYGSAIADARVDIYALGHILYEMAMDCTFWDKQGWPGNRFDDFVKFLSKVPQPPECIDFHDFSCDFYDKAKEVIAHMVKTNPDERYSTVEEVIMALGDEIGEEASETPEPMPVNLNYPLLIIESGTNKDARMLINVQPDKMLIFGRFDIAGNDSSISSRHLVFTRSGNRYFVNDHNSKNGTLLNGVMLKASDPPKELKHGDRLKVGDIFLRCLLPSAF